MEKWGMRNGKMGMGNEISSGFVNGRVDPWWEERKGAWSKFVNFVNNVLIVLS